MSKRKHTADARDGGGSSKRKYARGGTGNSFIHGPGIFVSCTRGKEHKAAAELIDFLEEIVSRNYADVEIEEGPGTTAEEAQQEADQKLAERELDEDDMDALLNGELPVASASSAKVDGGGLGSAKEGEDDESSAASKAPPKVDENDVEAQIQAELAELRQQGSGSRGGDASTKSGQGKGKKAERRKRDAKFKIVDTGMECFRFVSVARPLDPIALVHHLLSDVERTGSARSRFIQRLTPVTSTHIATEEQLLDVATKELPPRFLDGAEGEVDSTSRATARTFKIEVRIRNHQTLRRDDVIRNVGQVIAESCGPQHRANLADPDLVIVVEVFKSIFGMGVLKDYERFRRYNVLELAKKVNEDPGSETALRSRTLVGGDAETKGERGEP